MKRMILQTALVALLATACRSEMSDKPAAEVQNASSADATSSSTPVDSASNVSTRSVDVIKEKSSIAFVGANPIDSHEGTFGEFTGQIDYAGTEAKQIRFEVDTNSVKTDAAKLDKHLKSPDFFDTAKFPKATFQSTSIAPLTGGANGATHEITGILNMHGVEKSIKFPARVEMDANGIRARSEFTIQRKDWGIVYQGAPDKVIKDDVLMKIDLYFPPAQI